MAAVVVAETTISERVETMATTMAEVEKFQRHNGDERVLKAGTYRAVIVDRWFGKKTAHSKKATWNETIFAAGPIDWVKDVWSKIQAVR